MKVSVIVFNYNYEQYVCEAVESALNQTRVPDEIVVVDDGSADGSREILRERFGADARVKFHCKENGGHMSAFNEGYAQSTGDVIFFLDADDQYAQNHVEATLEVFDGKKGIDYVFCAYRYIGDKEGDVIERSWKGDQGYTLIPTYSRKAWIGGPTSAIAIRRELGARIFPYPEGWSCVTKNNGEMGLVLGASLLGARKYYLAEPHMHYRSHGLNFMLNQKLGDEMDYKLKVLERRVIDYYLEKAGLSDGKKLMELALSEFKTKETPTWPVFIEYSKYIMKSDQGFFTRLSQVRKAFKYYLKKKNGSTGK